MLLTLLTEDEFIEAERHLLVGIKSSADILASILYRWYTSSRSPASSPPPSIDPAIYLSRAILPYLLLHNFRDATRVHFLFTSSLALSGTHPSHEIQASNCDAKVFPDLPLINFLGLLLLAVQRGAADSFRSLKTQYAQRLKEVPQWEEPLEQIAEMYFGIRVQRQANLFDMMGSLFGTGPGIHDDAGGAPQLGLPPPSAELD